MSARWRSQITCVIELTLTFQAGAVGLANVVKSNLGKLQLVEWGLATDKQGQEVLSKCWWMDLDRSK